VRLSNLGNALDAHDGKIAFFEGKYYLYGTSYDCGFEWGNHSAPFCGFKSYSSADMINWKEEGYLFNAKNELWQKRCDGKTYGCFRPHVVYNKRTQLYVLWINVYDNVSGYRVFTSKTPAGPFTEVAEPVLGVNRDAPAAGLNNGDHDLFVDDDGQAYLAYTDWRAKGAIVIEALNDDYLTGTGKFVAEITPGKTEAPCLFKRAGRYYLIYSDPNCGYCSGTGSSYRMATQPLGEWSEPKKISANSCGGQPSFVSVLDMKGSDMFLYGSDLWNNAAKNEALANFFWMPLKFDADGAIEKIDCNEVYKMPLTNHQPSSSNNRIITKLTLDSGAVMKEIFTAKNSGTITAIELPVFQSGNPNAALEINIFSAGNDNQPVGKSLAAAKLPIGDIGWSVKNLSFKCKLPVKKGRRYCLQISSALTKGGYGFGYEVVDDTQTSLKYLLNMISK